VLAYNTQLLKGREGMYIFDYIEVLGDKIHTAVKTSREYIEQWFNYKGDLLLYTTLKKDEKHIEVYGKDITYYPISKKVYKTKTILDENGNARGVLIFQCKDIIKTMDELIKYYDFNR